MIGAAVLPILSRINALQPVRYHLASADASTRANPFVVYRVVNLIARGDKAANHRPRKSSTDRSDNDLSSIGGGYRFNHEGHQLYNFQDDVGI